MDTSGIQREARALGDPTRHRLFHYIVDSKQPVGVAELTACVQLNHNAVRQHLAGLLAQAVKHEWSPREVGRREGPRRAEEYFGTGDPVDAMEQELIHRGFRPARSDRGQKMDFVLGRCLFAEVAGSSSRETRRRPGSEPTASSAVGRSCGTRDE